MAIKELYQIKLTGGKTFQDEVLRTKAEYVYELSQDILETIQDLRDTLWAYPFCIGLSAPQIGKSYSISVVNIEKKDKEMDLVLINPQILETSGKKDKKRESCMSVWGKSGEVERRDKILVEYLDINLDTHMENFSGFKSRAIQHEIDHLNGIVYTDKLVPNKELQTAEFFNDYKIIY
jgi:peptide deformylase